MIVEFSANLFFSLRGENFNISRFFFYTYQPYFLRLWNASKVLPFLVNHKLFLHTVIWRDLKAICLMVTYTSKNCASTTLLDLYKVTLQVGRSATALSDTWVLGGSSALNNFSKSVIFVLPDVRIPEREERRLPKQCNSQKKGSLLLTRIRAPAARPTQWYGVRGPWAEGVTQIYKVCISD